MSDLSDSAVKAKSSINVNNRSRGIAGRRKKLADSVTGRIKPRSRRLQYPVGLKEASESVPGLINRYRLESGAYWLLRTAVALTVLFFFYHFYLLFAGSVSLESGTALLLIALFVSAVRIPRDDLITIGKKRADIRDFFSRELRFALIFTFVVFFLGSGVDSFLFGIFLLANFGLQTVLFAFWFRYNKATARIQNRKPASKSETNIIIIGGGARGKHTADLFLEHPELNIRVLGFVDNHRKNALWRYRDIPLLGHPRDLGKIILENRVDHVVVAMETKDFHHTHTIFSLLGRMGVDVCVTPQIHDGNMADCRPCSINGQPMLLYRSTRQDGWKLSIKDVLDKIGALVGLILFAPLLLLSAIAIKIDSRGPVIYKQVRSGRNGKTFEMYKLRTMMVDAEEEKRKLDHLNEMTGPVFKIKKDPRVTRVGKLLRKFSIDEFPQFMNVLIGDMSLVGPRPPLPKEVSQYKPWQRRKLSVKPGATCLWQISGRNHIDFDTWAELDLKYIDNWSLKEDARILLKTIPAVLKGNGAS